LIFLIFISFCTLTLFLMLNWGKQQALTADLKSRPAKRQLVSQLQLTDLSIWSEARYTRHPSQADLFTAFQDFPGAFDHFPAGSIIGPGNPLLGTRLLVQKKGAH
jgi:hypothetical protein